MFKISELTKKVGLNTIYQVLGRFVTAFTGLIVTKLIINHLGLEGYGDYQIVINYATIFWLLTDFGLNAVVVREMASAPDKEGKLFGGLVTMRFLLSIVILALSLIVLIFLPYSLPLKIAVVVGCISIITQGIKGATHGLFQSRLRYDYQFFAYLAGSIVFLVATYINLRSQPTTLTLVIAFIIGQIVAMATSIWLADKLSRFHFDYDRQQLKHLSWATLPLGISLLFNLGNFKTDTFLLSVLNLNHLSNSEAVGIYNLAYKFFEFGLIVPTFFMNAVYPIMVSAYERSMTDFRRVFLIAGGVLLSVGVLGAIVTWFLAPWVIGLIADSPEFGNSVTVLRILMGFAPVFFTTALLMWTALTFKLQKMLIYVYAVAFLVNVTSNLIFIPEHSFYAAALNTGLSETVILLLLGIIVWRHWPAKPHNNE